VAHDGAVELRHAEVLATVDGPHLDLGARAAQLARDVAHV
jgi:hypothetical protein